VRDLKKTYVTVLGKEQARLALAEAARDAGKALDALDEKDARQVNCVPI